MFYFFYNSQLESNESSTLNIITRDIFQDCSSCFSGAFQDAI